MQQPREGAELQAQEAVAREVHLPQLPQTLQRPVDHGAQQVAGQVQADGQRRQAGRNAEEAAVGAVHGQVVVRARALLGAVRGPGGRRGGSGRDGRRRCWSRCGVGREERAGDAEDEEEKGGERWRGPGCCHLAEAGTEGGGVGGGGGRCFDYVP